MKVITNSRGSSDYIRILNNDDVLIWCGHRIKPSDLVTIINCQGGLGERREEAELIEVDDEEIDEYGH